MRPAGPQAQPTLSAQPALSAPPALPSGPGRRWRLALRLAAALAVAGVLPALAQDDAPLKAAIVFNVLNFVQWPGEADLPPGTPLQLCVARGSALWPQLASLRDRPLWQFRLLPRELADGDSPRDCRVLVLDGPAQRRGLPRAAPALLTVDADEHAGDTEAVLGLRPVAGRVAFDVDLAAARRNGLQISSKLLRLARVVRE